jgi:hypothetical protein
MKMSERERQNKLEQGMTVADLVEHLQSYDQDSPVFFVCNYGDYHRTQQALPVEHVEEATRAALVESAYSNSGLALVDGDDDKNYYCNKCDEEWTVTTCPKCKERCVDEAGNPADDYDDENLPVVILQ